MQHLTRYELYSLLLKAKEHNERDWLIFLVSYWHGLRVSEVLSLRAANFTEDSIIVQRIKGSMKTQQPLMKHPDHLFNEYDALKARAAAAGNGRLFTISRNQVWRLIQKYGTAAGIARHKLHPHVLKHSIAMQSIREAGIENVRQHLGHKNLSSTGSYLRVSDEQASNAVFKAAA